MLKSALKKSSSADPISGRHVTFCKTVEIYGNSVKPDCVSDKFGDLLTDEESSQNIELLSLKSMLKAIKSDNCSDDPNDFFVHKVFYDDDDQLSLNDSSDDLKVPENNQTSPNESDSEEFIVHQVTLQEEDESSDSDNSSLKENGVCELNIQNIEQHNKLTEAQLLLECEVVKPLVMASLDDSEIILSPPLQELSVDRIICPQNSSDKWFWNLDLSPLNSIQETDSESNLSSEDTIIMMTSEESAKNEQKIQESLQKFESLKKLKDTKPDLILCNNITDDEKQITVPTQSTSTSKDKDFAENIPQNNSIDLVNNDLTNDVTANELFPENSALPFNSWDKCLTAVEIPKDVREWKISIDKHSFEKSRDMSTNDIKPDNDIDELAHFVDQCTERVERIRKRYSINENMLWTPRRGIRPRFGSSAEILQHSFHGKFSPGNSSNNHYSWPYYVSDDQQNENHLTKPHSTGVLTNFFDSLPFHEYIEQKSETLNDMNWSMVNGHTLPPPFQERRSPDGASPPRLSTESLNDSDVYHSNGENIVYYSMHV